VFLVVPLCTGFAIWAAWRLGRRLDEPLAAWLSVPLLAVSPTLLTQAVQPMSDVPATAAWMGALLLAASPSRWSAAAAGGVASLAILIRPNLAPLALLVGYAAASSGGRFQSRRALAWAAASLPGLAALAVIQEIRHGSPLASGYGPVSGLFAVSNIAPNLTRYPRWLAGAHSPLIWTWLLAPVWIRSTAGAERRLAWTAYAFALAVVCAYLPYSYFGPDEWFYTRFLLPALPVMLLLGLALVRGLVARVSPRAASPATVVFALAIFGWSVLSPAFSDAFTLRALERKYPAAGAFVDQRLPSKAYVLAMQHSGSIRYYAGRPILRWDLLPPGWLDRALVQVRAAGYQPFLVVDPDEDLAFRARFAGEPAVTRLTLVGTALRTRVYVIE
jgi:hypothetical protein